MVSSPREHPASPGRASPGSGSIPLGHAEVSKKSVSRKSEPSVGVEPPVKNGNAGVHHDYQANVSGEDVVVCCLWVVRGTS